MAAPYVKNTFIELDDDVDEDSAFAPTAGFPRQCTDSVLVTRRPKLPDEGLDVIAEAPTVDTLPPLHVEDLVEPSSDDEITDAALPLQRARKIAKSGGGLSGLTTAMLRNVPQRYTEKGLMTELNRCGYIGKYDFFFLPFNERARRNRGFAFINFSDAEEAQRFYDQYHGRFLRNFTEEGSEPLLILPADVQGFEANEANARVARGNRQSHGNPVILRALPQQVDSLDQGQLARVAKIVAAGILGQNDFQSPAVPFQAPSSLELPPWPLTCAGAGQMQPPQPQMQMRPAMQRFCGSCGGQLHGGFRFCPYCGCQKDM